jgi:hypothetical protein
MEGGYYMGNFFGIKGEVETIRKAEGAARDVPRRNTPNSTLTVSMRDLQGVKHGVDFCSRSKGGD